MDVTGLKRWGSVVVVALAVAGTLSAAPAAALREPQGRTEPGRSAVVADAARDGDLATVRRLLKEGGDVNAAPGDGTTALHHAAIRGDADMVSVLLYAGANVRATTRLGGYTPLHLASQRGHEQVIELLVKAGANPNQPTATGTTPLMFAAASGHVAAVKQLVAHKVEIDAKEQASGQTALMFASAFDRPDVVKLLVEVGADTTAASKVIDVATMTSPEEALQEEVRLTTQRASAQAAGRPAPTTPDKKNEIPGVTRSFRYNELIGKQGGFEAIHYAARQGSTASVMALVDGGVDVNVKAIGDGTTPLLMAIINGHYDLALGLLDRGADPNLASEAGATPLYATINIEWAPKSFYPQPRAQLQQRTGYMALMKTLLDKGADPNARLRKKVWYTQYNFDLLRTDESGATAFWRAAYASDIEAMKLLLSYGADPFITTVKGPTQEREQQGGVRAGDANRLPPMPVGSPGINALHAAAGVGYGEGFAGNAHRYAPTGMLAAVKFLVEEVGIDINAVDDDGNTAVHHAASRGDNEMIQYLVSKGADVTKVNRAGLTTVDMANGPVQRTQPYPETIKLLESLGAKNNHKCVSC